MCYGKTSLRKLRLKSIRNAHSHGQIGTGFCYRISWNLGRVCTKSSYDEGIPR